MLNMLYTSDGALAKPVREMFLLRHYFDLDTIAILGLDLAT
jgi:hypothetical protein